MVPQTKEDFDNFAKALCEKIRLFNSSEHYNDMLESITKDLIIDSKSNIDYVCYIFCDYIFLPLSHQFLPKYFGYFVPKFPFLSFTIRIFFWKIVRA